MMKEGTHTYFASIFVFGNVIYSYELHVCTSFQRYILCQKCNLHNWIKNDACGAHLAADIYDGLGTVATRAMTIFSAQMHWDF